MNQVSLGVMARSLKEHERRLALHPQHLGWIPANLRERIYLEGGFGDAWPPRRSSWPWMNGYEAFAEVSDEDVIALLAHASHR